MSATIPTTPTPAAVNPLPASRLSRLTVAQYDRLIEADALADAEELELIEGLLVTKMGRNRPHVQAVRRAFAVLLKIAPQGWLVAKEDPIVASEWSKPEPDLYLVRGTVDDYDERDATTRDVALVLEIADSSLAIDRDVKGRLYAAGGVPVYWIVNLVEDIVEVYSGPDPIRGCQTRRDHRRGDSIPVLADGRELGLVAVEELSPPSAKAN